MGVGVVAAMDILRGAWPVWGQLELEALLGVSEVLPIPKSQQPNSMV